MSPLNTLIGNSSVFQSFYNLGTMKNLKYEQLELKKMMNLLTWGSMYKVETRGTKRTINFFLHSANNDFQSVECFVEGLGGGGFELVVIYCCVDVLVIGIHFNCSLVSAAQTGERLTADKGHA